MTTNMENFSEQRKKFLNFDWLKICRLQFHGYKIENGELDTRIRKASAVMRQLYRLVAFRRKLCTKAKLSKFSKQFLFVPSPIIMSFG